MSNHYQDLYDQLLQEIINEDQEERIIYKLASFDVGVLEDQVIQKMLTQDKDNIENLSKAISGSIFDYKEEVLTIQGQQEENDINQSTDGFLSPPTGGSSNY